MDDTTSMLFRFAGGATGYLGTVVATAETWRLQVFGSKGWAEAGDVEHLTTWQMKVSFIDGKDVTRREEPRTITFPAASTERAELEHFAESALARRPIAAPGGDEVHNVAVLEAIVKSAREGSWARIE
jgi:predicted dehydrogenase